MFLAALLFVLTILINAQIPNKGFENWTTTGNYENPNGWATMNNFSVGTFYSCEKSDDSYPVGVGNYSIKLTNNTAFSQMTGGFGMTATNAFDYPFKPAFPIIGHPTSLKGYYKYVSINNDSMFVEIILFNEGTIVCNNEFVTYATTTEWTPFNVPISNYVTADSATIIMSAFYPSHPTDVPKGNSSLKIDNLNFDTFITGINEQTTERELFHLYPNPASDVINLDIPNVNNECLTLNIYNLTGSVVKSEILKQNKQQINIGDLNQGV